MNEKEMIRRIEAAEGKQRGWLSGYIWGLFIGALVTLAMGFLFGRLP